MFGRAPSRWASAHILVSCKTQNLVVKTEKHRFAVLTAINTPRDLSPRGIFSICTGVREREHRPSGQRKDLKHWDSAYLRQGTSYQCRGTDRHQNLIICSLAHCQPFLKNFTQVRWEVFARSC